ncbi:hypothetical protein PR048_024395 [Dryococelus australis]|uniref:WD repeat domain 34 n=1 Tax=Dryococelus australis TaxID=614101 RepID=A0ABQ9GNK6_9NEOP|nr:hypothetical protein PR048_024395 [Dryococelus australis]
MIMWFVPGSSSQDAEAQTDQRVYEDADCQAGFSHSIEVGLLCPEMDPGAQTEGTSLGTPLEPEVDYNRLAAFLRGVCPKVLSELDKVERSRAFRGYDPTDDDGDDEVKRLHVLLTPELKSRVEVRVSCLAWSCFGRMVAVGYSRPEHESWCDHNSAVHLFYISRHDFSPSSPGYSLETSSCVTSLAAHPSEPTLIAVGTFSGEVSVWNVQWGAQGLVGSSAGSHQEAVSQLCWVRSPDPSHVRPLLASAGRDGRLFLWQAEPTLGSFHLLEGFVMTLEHVGGGGGKGSRVQASPLGGRSSVEVGLTALSFSPHDPASFTVGLEGGGLLRCSTLLARQSSVASVIPLKDPVLTDYEGHQGTVTCVQHSVHRQDLFLSCDATEIHLHDVNQASPLRVIHPASEVLGLDWVSSYPHLFIVWGPSGTLEYHSINNSQTISCPALLSSEDRDPAPVTAVVFSPGTAHQLVAVGYVQGRIMVWKVPRVKDPSLGEGFPVEKQ